MLGLLTIVGMFLAKTMIGPGHNAGAIGAMQGTTVNKIANDTD